MRTMNTTVNPYAAFAFDNEIDIPWSAKIVKQPDISRVSINPPADLFQLRQ